ncbi:MAG: helix-turn-helix domain-containing protein [Clostridiaceae bacterium]|nr:helix-turn-helix domain-containing protein [Clostridiaceae bacterium]
MKIEHLIKNRRKELGLTLKQVADALGVAESTVSRYESSEIRNMGIDKIEALTKVLLVSPSYLMGWDSDEIDEEGYYLSAETKEIANAIAKDNELKLLFSAAKDAPADDLKTVHEMLKALKRKEKGEHD